jgi:hypothetical protein
MSDKMTYAIKFLQRWNLTHFVNAQRFPVLGPISPLRGEYRKLAGLAGGSRGEAVVKWLASGYDIFFAVDHSLKIWTEFLVFGKRMNSSVVLAINHFVQSMFFCVLRCLVGGQNFSQNGILREFDVTSGSLQLAIEEVATNVRPFSRDVLLEGNFA